jgi:hypothetical protein
MQVVIFYHTKALRDLKTKDIALRAFVPPWETFSQQRESQGFHAKDVVEKFRHVVTIVSKK